MTPKAVDEAVERVKAFVAVTADEDPADNVCGIYIDGKPLEFTFSDLRALLPALELGSVASLPVVTADEPATPSDVALLDAAEDEAYDVGKDDGYALAMQEVDEATGRAGAIEQRRVGR